jgi:uncharacterized protein
LGVNEKRKKQQRLEIIFLIIAILVIFAGVLFAQRYVSTKSKMPVSFITSKINSNFLLDVVSTPEERAKGLMYITYLPENEGMLFVFPKSEKQTFWMKNTPLPLDLIFIDDKFNVVGIVDNATPFSEKRLSVDEKSKYIIEINGGLASKKGIEKGSKVSFGYPLPKGLNDPEKPITIN